MYHRLEWLLGVPCLKIEYPKYQVNGQPVVIKAGVSAISAPDEEIIEYKTTLYKRSSGVKDSYLKLLF
jgi:hypothetical protein